jgi:segregation and condensation protein A
MAAWLAYLKSRLLRPPAENEPLTGEELATDLAFRLARLAAMREKAAALFARPRLGRDVFSRGAPERTVVSREIIWQASMYDLLTAYAERRQRDMVTEVRFQKRKVWSLVDARKVLERLAGRWADWVPLDAILGGIAATSDERKTVRASGFGAALEMAKEGRLTLRQTGPFSPIYIRAAAAAANAAAGRPIAETRGEGGEAPGERPQAGE